MITIDEVIGNEKDLGSFLSEREQIPFDQDDLQFRIYLIKNYAKSQTSCLVFITDHALSDGIGATLIACGL
jgi:hypothetical protein